MITVEDSKNNGYNSTNGGDENPMFGRKHTAEALAKISARSSGKNNPMYGKTSAMKGKKHSSEAIEKMSLAKIGDNNPSKRPDIREKISKNKKGKKSKVTEKVLQYRERQKGQKRPNHSEKMKEIWRIRKNEQK